MTGIPTIVFDNDFLVTGWENGRVTGSPSLFLDELINFYRSHGYEVVTNNVIEEEFLAGSLPDDLQAARQAWWDRVVRANNLRVQEVVGNYSGKGAGERSLLKETIPSLAQNGDLSHVKLYALEDFLRSRDFTELLSSHPELSRENFVQDWAGDFSDRIRFGSPAAAVERLRFVAGAIGIEAPGAANDRNAPIRAA